jgi:hypothetical protein
MKMRPVETILRIGEERIKENGGGVEFRMYCKHFCKCHIVAPAQQQYSNRFFFKVSLCSPLGLLTCLQVDFVSSVSSSILDFSPVSLKNHQEPVVPATDAHVTDVYVLIVLRKSKYILVGHRPTFVSLSI